MIHKKVKIGRCVLDNMPFLIRLSAMNGKGRKNDHRGLRELIVNASVPQLLALVEIATNVIRARTPLHNNRLIPKLVEQAHTVRALSRARTPRAAKQILMVQTGRGIPAIAGLLASAVIPLLTHIINAKTRN